MSLAHCSLRTQPTSGKFLSALFETELIGLMLCTDVKISHSMKADVVFVEMACLKQQKLTGFRNVKLCWVVALVVVCLVYRTDRPHTCGPNDAQTLASSLATKLDCDKILRRRCRSRTQALARSVGRSVGRAWLSIPQNTQQLFVFCGTRESRS